MAICILLITIFLVTHTIDIFIGTESHLNESILNSEVFPSNYQTYRKDSGGVFISIQSSILCTQINDNSTIEIVWTHVHLDKNNDFIAGSFYCPPHSSDTILDDLQSSIDTLSKSTLTLKSFLEVTLIVQVSTGK